MTRFEYASDRSLMVYVDDRRDILKLLARLEAHPIPGIRNLHPASRSMLIVFDPIAHDHAEIERGVIECLHRLDENELPEPREIEISVRYGGAAGPDLDDVARLHGFAPERVIELHCSARYSVSFLGFAPGFAYLDGLPRELETPRLPSPRKRVPAGSVGIGGAHTGVYPFDSPGGWRLIGSTALAMFDPSRAEPSLLRVGDAVRFKPIR
ncbi:MAG: 5-oxoprolinase subunit PxpB [Bryobacteraceae bacterium]